MDFQNEIKNLLKKSGIKSDIFLEIPPNREMGDYAFTCFNLAKEYKKSPIDIAKNFAEKIPNTCFLEKVEANGPYINFFLNHNYIAKNLLKDIYNKKDKFGSLKLGKNKKITIDFSSPNIAKPFSIGHLRSTVIGNSLYNIFKFIGYNPISINHLGDWGTQFGKLIFAYKKWGSDAELKKDPIKYLLSIYVKFHDKAEKDKTLEDKAREEFKKLENNDKKNLILWKKFRNLSLKEFDKIYKLLNIKFDSYDGEAFYIDKTKNTLKTIKEKIKTEKSEGAEIINLEKYNMPPVLILKSNKTSSYHTRDISTALYRLKKYKPEKLLYVVGSEQKLNFEQLFKVFEMLGFQENKFVHVDFGLFKFKDKKMSTRKGQVIFLEDVINEAIKKAENIIKEKNPNLENKNDVAKKVGIGAIIFGDLKNDRVKNIEFNWDKILSFDGETGPYLQYTYARCCSVISKSNTKIDTQINFDKISKKEEIALIKKLNLFEDAITKSANNYKPSYIASYLIDLAKDFNEFYNNCKILSDDKEEVKIRLLLVSSTAQIIKNGLNLLGIETVNKM
ncbi:MAG: arginine--tRNA ligase [Patescibacteria group bacterium]|nr:arginine--tRNA ligase [Patescibacteria group bacterium]MDD4304345.1 arginine--tRNA ligase [Patescibacteria group bacterium]MDD4695368.1 arginine--tRNA ligase [Patescibacteria group bacterium]